jgi:RNA polymerase sigma factor (sigma-70 family)
MSRPPLSFLFPRDDGVPDAVLLRRYAADRDEAAFELLVRRYADVVWTVCRAAAGGHHAAEDAFQATFLTLAKKATSVRENLAGWLYRVGYRAALKARARPASTMTVEPSTDAPEVDDVAPLIHAELAALPDRYRLPLLLCDLDGLTHAEAAKQLGWPVGSVSGRLVRGRERLKEKLVRRGVAPMAVVLTAMPLAAASPLIRSSTAAATGGFVPPAAAALSHGVISAMRIAKLKLTAAVAAGVMGVATVIGVSAAPQDPKPTPPLAAAAKKDEKPAAKALIANAKQRALSVNRIKQILLACHNYHDANGHFPADVIGKDGKPLLSWRVLILPYIEEAALYQKFKLDEPWDSAHNKLASATVVKLFTNGHEPQHTKYPMTFFQRPTGKGLIHDPAGRPTADEGGGTGAGAPPAAGFGGEGAAAGGAGLAAPADRGGKIRLVDITDGSSNTIFLIEAEKAVEWAKPDDPGFDVAKPTDVRGLFANVLHCGMADGSVRTFAGGLGKDAAKVLFGRADGVPFSPDYRGTGWAGSIDDPKEAAELAKELEGQTAELKKLLDENQKLQLELMKLQAERTKKAWGVGVAAQLIEVERLIENERERKRQLEEQLKAEKK